MPPHESKLLKILLSLVVCLMLATVISSVGWYLATRGARIELADLGPEHRQALVEELLVVAGSGYRPAWFEPGLGYTLRPNQRHELWGDTFTSNELGYRAGAVAKAQGTFRVLFVGDSWTYGMGLGELDSFPRQFQELANQVAGLDQPIEAWNLSLPGYNSLNQVSALELFLERLDPDAVVICPTANDNHTGDIVLPNGSPKRPVGRFRDLFGDDHALRYSRLAFDSFKCLERWQRVASELGRTADWLESRSIPCLFFFVAYWEEPFVHRLVDQGPIRAPYKLAPRLLWDDQRFRGPPPWKHGTRECYRRYAGMVYSGLAELLGWKAAPPDAAPDDPQLFRKTPEGDWNQQADEWLRKQSSVVPPDFKPGELRAAQCAGPMDVETGLMGRATTVLIRRLEGSRELVLQVRRVPGTLRLYPLELTVTIPGATGGSESRTRLPAQGPEVHEFVVPLPADQRSGSVLDVEVRARRVTLSPETLALRSVLLERVVQR